MTKTKIKKQLTTTEKFETETSLLTTTEIKLGRTTYEITSSFNGNQNKDMKSSLLRLMIEESKRKQFENTSSETAFLKNEDNENMLQKSG